MTTVMSKKFRLWLVLLLAAILWVPSATAQEIDRIMIMPIKAKNTDLERNLPDFTARVREYFRDNARIVVLGGDQLESLLDNATGTNRQLVQVAGEKLNCQNALLITLERYRERLGDEYSVTDPASLAFAYQLVNVANGRVICFGQFDETQKPVSENVLAIGQAFRRGFKWVTIADLTKEALRRKFTSCPDLAGDSVN